jgi:hypothetical protein
MVTLKLVFMLLAVVLFFLAAIGIQHPRCNLLAAGLCLWALATMLT